MNTTRVLKLHTAFQREGLNGLIKLIGKHFKKIIFHPLLAIVSIPITLTVILISPWIRIRFFMLLSDRIGHYAGSTEVLLCMLEQSPCKLFDKMYFYLIPGAPISNYQLHRMWKRKITILPFSYIWADVNRYLMKWGGKNYREDPYKKFFDFGDGCDRWNLIGKINKCRLQFNEKEKKEGKYLLDKMGIPTNAHYVCLLDRDSNYLKIHKPTVDCSYHDYRNVNIDTYKESALYLAEKGYYVIRMGKYAEKKFNVAHQKIYDYATSQFRSDFMDIYLTAHCFFFISVGTGLDAVAQIFRKPILITNYPLSDRGVWPDWRLFITKKVVEIKSGRQLTFNEIFNIFTNTDHRNVSTVAASNGLVFIDNTPEEIREAVEEMEQRMLGKWNETSCDFQLQEKFWSNYPDRFSSEVPNLILPLFRYQNINNGNTLRVGSSFLKKHFDTTIKTDNCN